MSKVVLIVKNEPHEGPGLLETVLQEHSIESHVVDLKAGEDFPSPTAYAALIVMGGEDSANDQTEKILNQLSRIREAIQTGLPYFGVCLGLQVLVKAAGGTVRKNDIREVGFRDPKGEYFTAEFTKDGRKDPLMKGLPEVLPMFHLHGETVELKKGMSLLASGAFCKNQIVRAAVRMYGIQGHLELTDAMFEEWCAKNDWLRECDQDALKRDWAERKEVLERTLRTLFGNFLGIAGLL